MPPLPKAFPATPADDVDAIIDTAMAAHNSDIQPFFDYLRAAGPLFSPAQFDFYRANFFYRTQTTVAVLQLLYDAALRRRDNTTATMVQQTIFEELGSGDDNESHPLLLERSHNTHARVVFGLPPLARVRSEQSPLVIDAARTFRSAQSRLYESDNYPMLLGASLAQETAALDMLKGFRDALFAPYAARYRDAEQFRAVLFYFDCHLDGVEQQHAARARKAAGQFCHSRSDVYAVEQGAVGFLTAQADLWKAMQQGLLALDVASAAR